MRTSNVEYKAIDNCTNPHLAVAALICAGVLGIKQRTHLPDECTVDPASLSVEQRHERGILPLKPHLDDLLLAWDADAGTPYWEACMGLIVGMHHDAAGACLQRRAAIAVQLSCIGLVWDHHQECFSKLSLRL